MLVDLRCALLLVLIACTSRESATMTSSSAEQQTTASTAPPPPTASASASVSVSAAASADPAVEHAWQKVRAACAGGVFVSQPTFDPQMGGLASFDYYRFFENGVVVSASVIETEAGEDRAKMNAKVMRWLDAENERTAKGTYRLEGEKVVAELKIGFKGDGRRTIEADFSKPPFVMKSNSNGHPATAKYACPK